jgi:hypothetical protein
MQNLSLTSEDRKQKELCSKKQTVIKSQGTLNREKGKEIKTETLGESHPNIAVSILTRS